LFYVLLMTIITSDFCYLYLLLIRHKTIETTFMQLFLTIISFCAVIMWMWLCYCLSYQCGNSRFQTI